jgi:membrane fusion protein (multidrug efflux system)
MAPPSDDISHSDGASDETAAEQAAPSKRSGVRRILLIGLIVVVLILIVWFIRYQTYGKYFEGTNDAYIQADAVIVSPKIAGYVEQVYVVDNQDVKKGDPLVRIDPRDYHAQAAQYQAQVDVAAASADNIRAMMGEQQSAIDQARAQLAVAQSDAAFARSEVARYAPLATSGAETREKLTSLQNQATQAANRAAAQQAMLAGAERRVKSLAAQVRQAQAQGEAARAQLAAADVNVGSTILRASVAGRVGDKTVQAGQFVQPGLRMMSVVPLSAIYITANFKETQIGLMRVGQPVTIDVDALPNIDLTGHVESISPGTGAQFSLLPPQNATGNFTKIVQRVPVRIAIDAGPDARRLLLPGLSTTITVDTTSAKGSERRIAEQEKARRRQGQ